MVHVKALRVQIENPTDCWRARGYPDNVLSESLYLKQNATKSLSEKPGCVVGDVCACEM